MKSTLERGRWITKALVAAAFLTLASGAALAAEPDSGDGRGRRAQGTVSTEARHARHRNSANALGLTKQQTVRLAATRKAAMEATKDIEGHKERGKAIREQMTAARDNILTDEQKAKLQELRENHEGHGKGKVGPGGKGRGKGNVGPGGKGRGKGNVGPGGKGRGKGNAGPGGKGRGKGIAGPGKHGGDVSGPGQGKGAEGPGRRARRAAAEKETE